MKWKPPLGLIMIALVGVSTVEAVGAADPAKVQKWVDDSEALGSNRTVMLSLGDLRRENDRLLDNWIPYTSENLTACEGFSFAHPFPSSLDDLTEKEKQLLLGVVGPGLPESTGFLLGEKPLWLWMCYRASRDSPYPEDRVESGVWRFDEGDYRDFVGAYDYPGHRAFIRGMVSPVSRRIMRTDCAEFSPGNMYLRRLSREEIRKLVELDPKVDRWWEYSIRNGFSHPDDEPWNWAGTLTGKRIELNDTILMQYSADTRAPNYILYVRVYGEKDILFEGLL